MKQVKRQMKYTAAKAAAAAADTTITTSPTSQDVAATKEDELEEQSAADAVDEEGAQVKKKVRFAKPVSNVRWSTVPRRRTMPGSAGWTWDGRRDMSTEWLRAQYLERRSDEWVGSGAWPVDCRLRRHRRSFSLSCGACVLRNTWQPAVKVSGPNGTAWGRCCRAISDRIVIGARALPGRGLTKTRRRTAILGGCAASRSDPLSLPNVRRWYGTFVRI